MLRVCPLNSENELVLILLYRSRDKKDLNVNSYTNDYIANLSKISSNLALEKFKSLLFFPFFFVVTTEIYEK